MGSGATAGTPGDETGGTGGTSGTASTDPAAPVVTITSPDAEDDPNGPGVIVDRQVDVLCTAKAAKTQGATVEPSTVVIAMLDRKGGVVASSSGTATTNDDEYTAHFTMADVPDNGVVGFRCTAGDQSEPPTYGEDTVLTFVDHGPLVEFSQPIDDDGPVPLNDPLKIVFTVTESPVGNGDRGAKVGSVALTIKGQDIQFTEADGEYSATVKLNDAELFPNAPDDSTPIIVTASNRRMPRAAERQEIRRVIVDGTGPIISILAPPDEAVRGGKVQFTFSVKDEQSGVDPSSIVARLNLVPYPYSEDSADWSVAADNATYTFTFDTAQVPGSKVAATIDVMARDRVKNESQGASRSLYLDDQPPVVDLDPPPVRESNSDSTFCSNAFDPVGDYSANDLDTVYQLKKFRALVWDYTNEAEGQNDYNWAKTKLDSVVLRLQPNVDQGLLYDSDGDGVCDELLEKNADEPHEALPFRALTPVPGQGNAWFGPSDKDALGSDFPLPAGCNYQGTVMAPEKLCPPLRNNDMFRVIPWDYDATIPAIFGIGSLQGNACTGTDWEIGPLVKEGWICVAGRAMDNTDNVGISRPLRLCFDDGVDPPPTCLDHDADPPPSCTINCALPPAFAPGQTFVRR